MTKITNTQNWIDIVVRVSYDDGDKRLVEEQVGLSLEDGSLDYILTHRDEVIKRAMNNVELFDGDRIEDIRAVGIEYVETWDEERFARICEDIPGFEGDPMATEAYSNGITIRELAVLEAQRDELLG